LILRCNYHHKHIYHHHKSLQYLYIKERRLALEEKDQDRGWLTKRIDDDDHDDAASES